MAEAYRQDSTFRAPEIIAFLVCENDRLRGWIRELEDENARLLQKGRLQDRISSNSAG